MTLETIKRDVSHLSHRVRNAIVAYKPSPILSKQQNDALKAALELYPLSVSMQNEVYDSEAKPSTSLFSGISFEFNDKVGKPILNLLKEVAPILSNGAEGSGFTLHFFEPDATYNHVVDGYVLEDCFIKSFSTAPIQRIEKPSVVEQLPKAVISLSISYRIAKNSLVGAKELQDTVDELNGVKKVKAKRAPSKKTAARKTPKKS